MLFDQNFVWSRNSSSQTFEMFRLSCLIITVLVFPAITSAQQCQPGEFSCEDSGECIISDWECDGIVDCEDGSDEHDECQCEGFKCDDGQCIAGAWVCDGEDDCDEGEDELGCATDDGQMKQRKLVQNEVLISKRKKILAKRAKTRSEIHKKALMLNL